MTYHAKIDYKTLHESGHSPRFHVNGYIELYVDDKTCLHIWAPDDLAPFRAGGTIHAHRYSLRSYVIFGALHHSVYDVTMAEEGNHGFYEIPDPTGNGAEDGEEPVLKGKCKIELIESTVYQQGASYEFLKRRFHSAYTKGLAVSVIEKIDEDPEFRIKLVVPLDEEPAECAFDASIPPKRLWEIIHATCATLVSEGIIVE